MANRVEKTVPIKNTFAYFRQVWGPRASYNLTKFHTDPDGFSRLVAFIWLLRNNIPPSGEAPSLSFKGLPL